MNRSATRAFCLGNDRRGARHAVRLLRAARIGGRSAGDGARRRLGGVGRRLRAVHRLLWLSRKVGLKDVSGIGSGSSRQPRHETGGAGETGGACAARPSATLRRAATIPRWRWRGTSRRCSACPSRRSSPSRLEAPARRVCRTLAPRGASVRRQDRVMRPRRCVLHICGRWKCAPGRCARMLAPRRGMCPAACVGATDTFCIFAPTEGLAPGRRTESCACATGPFCIFAPSGVRARQVTPQRPPTSASTLDVRTRASGRSEPRPCTHTLWRGGDSMAKRVRVRRDRPVAPAMAWRWR